MVLVYGLSLGNHWPLMVLATPALLILALTLSPIGHALVSDSPLRLGSRTAPLRLEVPQSHEAGAEYDDDLAKLTRSFAGKLAFAAHAAEQGSQYPLEERLANLRAAERIRQQSLPKSGRAWLHVYLGDVFFEQGDRNAALDPYQKAMRIWPDPQSPAKAKRERLDDRVDSP